MNTILLILCNALSCFIISTILFQFMNGKYKRSNQNKYVYIVIETVTVIFTTCINMLNHSILNLVVWGVLTGVIAYALYYEDMDKPLRRIIECEALIFCMSVCESLGVILLQCILQAADIKNLKIGGFDYVKNYGLRFFISNDIWNIKNKFSQQYSVVPNEQQFCTETIKSSRD